MDKRTIFAIILVVIVFIFYDDYLRWVYPPPPESESDPALMQKEESQSRYERVIPQEQPSIANIPDDSPKYEPERDTTLRIEKGLEDYQEQIITVETERIIARISTLGAKLISYKLKPNGKYLQENQEVIRTSRFQRFSFRFWTYDGPFETNSMPFELADQFIEGDKRYKISSGQEERIEFITSLGDDRTLSVIYTFMGDGYTFTYETVGSGTEKLWVRDYTEVYWSGGLAYTEEDTSQDFYYSKAFTYFAGNSIEDLSIDKKETVREDSLSGTTKWSALRTKYFMAALIPGISSDRGSWMESIFDPSYVGKNHPNLLGVGFRIPLKAGDPVSPLRVFIGPLDYEIISAVDPTLDETMNWGWSILEPISKLILWTMKKLRTFVPNYGVCIIIFSILVKVILWPMTRKSYQSMAAMQQLQPKIKALQEKFKGDPKKLQKATMKMYKEEKVNPMGGCIPMMAPMLLLYPLFIVFRSTIEFRSAPFMLWITDLSKPDIIFELPFSIPLYGSAVAALPIIMGVSTYFQSRMTMKDPSQKMMLYMMPVFMTLIFNSFPSGLTFYYTLFNILTLIQQKITPPPKSSEAVPAKR